MKKLRKLLLPIISLCILAGSCAKDIVDNSVQVSGVVKDSETSELLANCQVTISSAGSVVTEADGSYLFTELEPNTYTLSFSKNGYEGLTKTVAATSAGQKYRADVLLVPKSSLEFSELLLDFGYNAMTRQVELSNYSNRNCDFKVGNIPDWAVVQPSSGIIKPESKAVISITIDRSKISGYGTFSHNLIFNYQSGKTKNLTIKLNKVKPSAPSVEVGTPYNITKNGFTVSGKIVSTGGSNILSYGHCWGIENSPTFDNCLGKTTFSGAEEVSEYTSDVRGLSANTKYYVRAYAENESGVSYSSQTKVVSTLDDPDAILYVSPSTYTFSSTGGSKQFNIESNVPWDVEASESWCNINNLSGHDNGSFVLTVPRNDGSKREAQVTVKSEGITRYVKIYQNGAPSVSPSSLNFGSGSETKTINIESDLAWTIYTSASWLTLDKKNGSSSASVKITASRNTSSSQRSAVVTISIDGQSFSVDVSQNGSSDIEIDGFEDDVQY